MGNVINLRQARKAKARTEKEKKAEANRARFGQTKAQKTKQRFETDKLERHLDGHKRKALDDDVSQTDDKSE
ncbi:DUF4169 family protein [uncultured Cohaesibacter sp.]|uniref:DUF4169 family protein n=1 Tax=uncultured Cohaesibacter sp. TaxID=1002546 RepID=UPI002AABD122|nr:DUF4169 family protein [uncultured Cohaesibacter sp.]